MASSRQEYFILRNDVPIAKTNNFFRNWLNTLNAEHVLKGELLVKETQPDDGSHAMYSLPLDQSKKVSCTNYDVVPLSKDDYEWLVTIEKPIARYQFYAQRDKLEAVKKMQVGSEVWVSLPVSEGAPFQLPGASCCKATVQYIGPLQGMLGRRVGVELKEKRGSNDGSFRDSRYFICKEDHGAFLSASHILSVSATTSAPSAPITAHKHKELLLSSEKSATDRAFYLDDPVVLFDRDGKRVPGVAKWAAPGKELGLNGYIIGIETDMPIKKDKVAEHIGRMGHYLKMPDYRKHTYLAIPELSVLKGDGDTSVDPHPEYGDTINPPEINQSALGVASAIASRSRFSPTDVISEQLQALQESEAKKEKADNEKLASFGMKPDDLKAQQEQYKKLERQQSENEQRCHVSLGTMSLGANGQAQYEMMQDRSLGVNRRHASTIDKHGPEVHRAAHPIPTHLVLDNLEVGSAVKLVDPPGYGTIRWIGKFPGVDQDIAGVEMETRMDGSSNGSWKGVQYFSCKDGHALFIVLSLLKPDRRHKQAQSSSGKSAVQTVKEQVVSREDALRAKDQQIEHLQRMNTHLREEHLQRENDFTARLSAMEARMRALQLPWAIPEVELEVTRTVLGKGAYGEVRIGIYCGAQVAVKRLHNIIASDYYHKMIQREMGIAARLRHPNLVLFIGAVTTGNLTIVAELMETSLRSELEHGRLKEAHLLPISRDVACALCYLHSLPEPIIHRDVSSANVLLNSRQGGWTAKLGDYGSANFQAKLQTVGPGCPVYAAPEASRPEEQGPKMDVYSYGVLLLEICTGTLPDPRDLPIIQQAVRTWGQPKRQLGVLACQCTLQSSDRRPHMRTAVKLLNEM